MTLNPLVIAGVVLLGIVAVALILRAARARVKNLAAVASQLGFEFSETANDSIFRAFPADQNAAEDRATVDDVLAGQNPAIRAAVKAQFEKTLEKPGIHRTALRGAPLFRERVNPYVRHVMSGHTDGLDALVFDYSYQLMADEDRIKDATQTVAAFRGKGREVTSCERVQDGFNVEAHGNCVIVYKPQKTLAPEAIPQFVRSAAAIAHSAMRSS